MGDILTLGTDGIKAGLRYDAQNGRHMCLFCGALYNDGEVYENGGRFFDAAATANRHVAEAHGGALEQLLALDKQMTGLTDNQKSLLAMMAAGRSDQDIARQTGVTAATVRHQRFMFREKAKQAKLYLCIYELTLGDRKQARGQAEATDELAEIHGGAKMVDERYVITKAEEEEIISNMFYSLSPLKLKNLSPKEKKKIVILKKIAGEFERGRKYGEKELNGLIGEIYDDFATVRRYLIEYGFMDRTDDGREYWLR